METSALVDLWRNALVAAAVVGGPFLIAALAVGIMTSVFQAATQIQEQILSFLPKLLAVGAIFAISGSWVLDKLTSYTTDSFLQLVQIALEAGQ